MIRTTSTPITATVSDFCGLSGIGRSKVYELLAARLLDSVKIGGRRLIVVDSYRRLVEQQQRDQLHPTARELVPDCASHSDENVPSAASGAKCCTRPAAAKDQRIPPGTAPAHNGAPFDFKARKTRGKTGKFSVVSDGGAEQAELDSPETAAIEDASR